jgi:hypothetical protein
MAIDWSSWILEKNYTFEQESLRKTDSVTLEPLEKAKYIPQFDTKELIKPEVPQRGQIPDRQKYIQDAMSEVARGRINQSDAQRYAEMKRAREAKALDTQHQSAMSDYQKKYNEFESQSEKRPSEVISGHRLHGYDGAIGSSARGTKYKVMTEYPERPGQKEPHLDEVHAHDDKLGSMLRIRGNRSHVLRLKRQGDNTTYSVNVTPEQYKTAMMTGYHSD